MIKQERKLELVEQGDFLGTSCDFYKDEHNQIYMTREQIGEALEYKNPLISISNIHSRNKDRLENFSVVTSLISTDGKAYNTHLYVARGIYDICRFSRQPVADEFYDWVYEQIETLRQTSGVVQLGSEKEFLDNYFPTLAEDTKLMMVKDLNKSIKKQQQKIDELEPKAKDWSAYMDAKGNITMSKLAKTLNIENLGRNKLFALLRTQKVLRGNNEPYQTYVNRGYFELSSVVKNGYTFAQTLVTPKGMSWINKKLSDWGILV